VILATPAQNAALEAALAVLMDALPNHAFQGKVVLPIVTGIEPRDRLAADLQLRPILRSKGAQNLLASVYVQDDETSCDEDGTIQIAPPLEKRLIGATADLFTPSKGLRPSQTLACQSFERDPDHAA
jgi:FMN reductase